MLNPKLVGGTFKILLPDQNHTIEIGDGWWLAIPLSEDQGALVEKGV